MKVECNETHLLELHLTMTAIEAETLREMLRKSLEFEPIDRPLDNVAKMRNVIRHEIIDGISRVF